MISSPCWPMIRSVVSPGWMVTVCPAWLKPTWMRWRATWMPPRLDTFRWMTMLAGGSGCGPARRTPWSLCRLPVAQAFEQVAAGLLTAIRDDLGLEINSAEALPPH